MFEELFNKIMGIDKEPKKQEIINLNTNTEIAKHFNISKNELENILIDMGWIEKKESWRIATNKGIKNGAEQKYNTKIKQKYILWDEKIKNNFEIINLIKKIKSTDIKPAVKQEKIKKIITHEERKEKGDKYEKYVADFFRNNGYYVWEHGKEKGVKDSSIDLIIKREKYIYFVQCKNWENWKIDHKEVKATRMDINEYLEKNEQFKNLIKNYKQKILYVTSKKCLTAGANKYIEENKEILEYQIIKMEE